MTCDGAQAHLAVQGPLDGMQVCRDALLLLHQALREARHTTGGAEAPAVVSHSPSGHACSAGIETVLCMEGLMQGPAHGQRGEIMRSELP